MNLPSVIALKSFVKPSTHPNFTRFNVFLRDKFTCQYCGDKRDLTFDHLIPKSKGGVTDWENVVTACSTCNVEKGGKFYTSCDLRLKRKPFIPTVDDLHKELGKIMWEYVGMARNRVGLKKALELIPKLKEDFWESVHVPGDMNEYNPELEKASRLADFLELGELMARDALHREESCGGHFREEYQTEENEAKRNDLEFMYVAALSLIHI